MFCQGFYALWNVDLMEQRMIRYLSWDFTISGSDLTAFADCIRANYEWVPKALHVVIPDKSCEQDSIRKSGIEERKSVATRAHLSEEANTNAHINTFHTSYCQLPLLHFERFPTVLHYISWGWQSQSSLPYSDISSHSSRESLPLSIGPEMPPDEVSSSPSTPRGNPVHVDPIN